MTGTPECSGPACGGGGVAPVGAAAVPPLLLREPGRTGGTTSGAATVGMKDCAWPAAAVGVEAW